MKTLYILSAFVLLTACNDENNAIKQASDSEEFIANEEAPISGNGVSTGLMDNKSNVPSKRKMIWKGNIKFQVEDVNQSSTNILKLVEENNGFITRQNFSNSHTEISNRLQIRVKQNEFNALIESLKSEAIHVNFVEITSNDVTEEFVDIESRLKTKKKVRDRYIDILNKKTGSVKDLIEAEEAIRKITEEIEAKEGRLRYLKDQVNYCTINLEIFQKVSYSPTPKVYVKSYGDKAAESLAGGWEFILGFTLLLLRIWPLLLVSGGVVYWKRDKIFKNRRN